MTVSIMFIFSALIFYTSSIFIEREIGYLKSWILLLFACGFTSDLIGTSVMFCFAKIKFSLALHTICGYSALLIMLAHLIWAILAIKRIGNYQKYFTRYSIYAWIVWIIAFVSGVPKVSASILSWLSF